MPKKKPKLPHIQQVTLPKDFLRKMTRLANRVVSEGTDRVIHGSDAAAAKHAKVADQKVCRMRNKIHDKHYPGMCSAEASIKKQLICYKYFLTTVTLCSKPHLVEEFAHGTYLKHRDNIEWGKDPVPHGRLISHPAPFPEDIQNIIKPCMSPTEIKRLYTIWIHKRDMVKIDFCKSQIELLEKKLNGEAL